MNGILENGNTTTTLVPEDELQELWMLAGRVEALKAYCRKEEYGIRPELILYLLGETE